jgi:general stress protein 26
MEWSEVVAAAEELGWPVYLGTVGDDGRPHLAVVAPGFAGGSLWFATRRGSRKLANLAAQADVVLHWAVGGDGPGELFLRGVATIHDSAAARHRLWEEAGLPYDPAAFFGSPDNDDVVFVEVAPTFARLLGPDFVRRTWSAR